jgi:hypothetical protein
MNYSSSRFRDRSRHNGVVCSAQHHDERRDSMSGARRFRAQWYRPHYLPHPARPACGRMFPLKCFAGLFIHFEGAGVHISIFIVKRSAR